MLTVFFRLFHFVSKKRYVFEYLTESFIAMTMQMNKVTPNIKISPLVSNMAVSKTIEIHSLTKEMEKNGQTVYSLCVGEPDYQPPKEVLLATVSIIAIVGFLCNWFLIGRSSKKRINKIYFR